MSMYEYITNILQIKKSQYMIHNSFKIFTDIKKKFVWRKASTSAL